MLDFAKSIMTGNASGIKEFNTEADLRRWCIEHQYAYTPTHGGYYRLEDDKPGRNRPDLAAHVKAGNSKVGNASYTKEEAKTKDEYFKILKFYQTQGYKTKAEEYNPNGRIKLHKGDDSVEIVLVGNSMVGNKDEEYTGRYIIMGDDGRVLFRNEHQFISFSESESWAQKRIAEYQRGIDEIKKGLQEAKQAAKKFGLI